MLCSNCGHDSPMSRQYCAQCGQALVPDFEMIKSEIALDRKIQRKQLWAGRLQLTAAILVLLLAGMWVYAYAHSRLPTFDSSVITLFPAPPAKVHPPPRVDDHVRAEDYIALPIPRPRIRAAEGMAWRSDPMRTSLRDLGGGSRDTGRAVDRALAFLAKVQAGSGKNRRPGPQSDGHWDVAAHGGKRGNEVGVNALVLLAFLANGHCWSPTHTDGGRPCPYDENVRRGIHWLVRKYQEQGATGAFVRQNSRAAPYQQAFATQAIVEAAAMTGDPELRAIARKAINYILTQQVSFSRRASDRRFKEGGWGYRRRIHRLAEDPVRPYVYDAAKPALADVSATAWTLLTLTEARHLFIDHMNKERSRRALQNAWMYLMRMTDHTTYATGYLYAPTVESRVSQTTHFANTTNALMARLALGGEPDEEIVRKQVAILFREAHLPDWKPRSWDAEKKRQRVDLMQFYAGTMAMYWVGGERWRAWNKRMRRIVLAAQNQSTGGWPNDGRWGAEGGRLYSTAVCTLILSVYYRYPHQGFPGR